MTRHKKWFLCWTTLILNVHPKYHVVITVYDNKHLQCFQKKKKNISAKALFFSFLLDQYQWCCRYKFVLFYSHSYHFFGWSDFAPSKADMPLDDISLLSLSLFPWRDLLSSNRPKVHLSSHCSRAYILSKNYPVTGLPCSLSLKNKTKWNKTKQTPKYQSKLLFSRM